MRARSAVAYILGVPALAFAVYIAWLVVPPLVEIVVPAVVEAVH